jgi:hypothetical protein
MSVPMNALIPEGVPLGALASALSADHSGVVKREYEELFINARNDARRRLHEPLPPQDHDAAAALAEGASECLDVVDAVWKALHP